VNPVTIRDISKRHKDKVDDELPYVVDT